MKFCQRQLYVQWGHTLENWLMKHKENTIIWRLNILPAEILKLILEFIIIVGHYS